MCEQSIFTLHFHLLVPVLTISVNLETSLKLRECARVVADKGNGTKHGCVLTYHKYVKVHGQAVHYGDFICICS